MHAYLQSDPSYPPPHPYVAGCWCSTPGKKETAIFRVLKENLMKAFLQLKKKLKRGVQKREKKTIVFDRISEHQKRFERLIDQLFTRITAKRNTACLSSASAAKSLFCRPPLQLLVLHAAASWSMSCSVCRMQARGPCLPVLLSAVRLVVPWQML